MVQKTNEEPTIGQGDSLPPLGDTNLAFPLGVAIVVAAGIGGAVLVKRRRQ